ncbi:MAG: hypothetical protein MUC84_09295 [Solirubrobacteraceae bacterium]|jgi:hypothetical protein|nr:hypothetical protein [Solirubrobacteraceae bacterium]
MRRVAAALAVLLAVLGALVTPAGAHEGDPRYRSEVRAPAPAVPGLSVSVVNYDDSLELVNRSGRDVVVQGYDGEPYARVLADGTVQLNRRSPATYLNDERYGDVAPPADASAAAPPRWRTVDRTARLTWHDHRMHWMSRSRPPAVSDPAVRTKVFDYAIPLEVAGRPVTLAGTLWWAGEPGGGMPAAAAVALGALALSALVVVVLVRRRRR